MDHPTITEPREAVPDWAQSQEPENGASQKQLSFIEGLRDEREIDDSQKAWIDKQLQGFISKARASTIIERLLKLPKRELPEFSNSRASLVELPAGRYAIENEQGLLRFYKKWVSRDGKRHAIYVQHGIDESQVHYASQEIIAEKILAAGIRQCAIRYGMEIGECSNCGRRLTNHISRALGIGPVCGGRMFGDDFKTEVRAKRAELKAAGIDPDEDV